MWFMNCRDAPSREMRGRADSGGSGTLLCSISSVPATLPMEVSPPKASEELIELWRLMPMDIVPHPMPMLLCPSARVVCSACLDCASATCMLLLFCEPKVSKYNTVQLRIHQQRRHFGLTRAVIDYIRTLFVQKLWHS
jgi:hypothetical protein